MSQDEQALDDLGTREFQAKRILKNLFTKGFDADVNKLALALGMDSADLDDLMKGKGTIGEDLLMKMRGIAEERDIEIE